MSDHPAGVSPSPWRKITPAGLHSMPVTVESSDKQKRYKHLSCMPGRSRGSTRAMRPCCALRESSIETLTSAGDRAGASAAAGYLYLEVLRYYSRYLVVPRCNANISVELHRKVEHEYSIYQDSSETVKPSSQGNVSFKSFLLGGLLTGSAASAASDGNSPARRTTRRTRETDGRVAAIGRPPGGQAERVHDES